MNRPSEVYGTITKDLTFVPSMYQEDVGAVEEILREIRK